MTFQGRRHSASDTSKTRGSLDGFCPTTLHHRNTHNPPVSIIDRLDESLALAAICQVSEYLFGLRATSLDFKRFFAPPLYRQRHGAAYNNSQEPTEGERDAHSVSVNGHIRFTDITQPLISYLQWAR